MDGDVSTFVVSCDSTSRADDDESELSLRDVPNGVMGDVLSGDFASLRGRGKGAAVAGETRFR